MLSHAVFESQRAVIKTQNDLFESIILDELESICKVKFPLFTLNYCGLSIYQRLVTAINGQMVKLTLSIMGKRIHYSPPLTCCLHFFVVQFQLLSPDLFGSFSSILRPEFPKILRKVVSLELKKIQAIYCHDRLLLSRTLKRSLKLKNGP